MRLFLLCVFLLNIMIVSLSAFNLDLDFHALLDLFQDYLDEALKAEKAERLLHKIPTEVYQIKSKEILYKSTAKFARLLKNRVTALKKLQKAVINSYREHSSITISCTKEHGEKHSYNFQSMVNFNRYCEIIAPYAKRNLVHLNNQFTSVAARNLKIAPYTKWQYFISVEGVLSLYPSKHASVHDGRLRPSYVQALSNTKREYVFILDRSGSMNDIIKKVKLIDIAKEIIKATVSWLSSTDKFAVVTASDDPLTPANFSESSCFGNQFAFATDSNLEILEKFLKEVKATGGSSFIPALKEAFQYFQNMSFGVEQRLILVSDAGINESPKSIAKQIKLEQDKLQQKVHVNFFVVGSADLSLLEHVALKFDPKRLKGSNIIRVKSFQDVYSQLNSFLLKYETFSKTSMETQWTLPYYDLFGLGAIFTASLPVFDKTNLLGVVSIDISIEEILNVLNVVFYNPVNYMFFITSKGETLYHPIFPISDETSVITKITLLEHGHQFAEGIEDVLRGVNEIVVNATIGFHSVPLGGTEYHGSKLESISKLYYIKKVEDFPFIVIVCIGSSTYHKFNVPNSGSKKILFHRIDLIPPPRFCKHRGTESTADYATLFLTPSAFEDPVKFISNPLTSQSVQEIVKFLEGSKSNPQKVKESAKVDTVITGIFQELWKFENDENVNLRQDVLARFVAMNSGVLRLYPGTQLPESYNPLSRSWFRQISAFPKLTFVLTSPYIDLALGMPIMTLGRTLRLKEKSFYLQNKAIGVMGMDLSVLGFNRKFLKLYPKCQFSSRYRCYLVDSAGFPLVISHLKQDEWFDIIDGNRRRWLTHLTELEPEVSEVLIDNNVMKQYFCVHLVQSSVGLFYRFTLKDGEEFTGSVVKNFFNKFSFRVYSIPQSNTLLIIRSLPVVSCYSGLFKCPCRRHDCYSDEEEYAFCQCPCFKHNSEFNPCNGSYSKLTFDLTPCVPPVSSIVYQPPDSSKRTSSASLRERNLKPCYFLASEFQDKSEDDSLEKIFLMTSVSFVTTLFLIFYVWKNKAKATFNDHRKVDWSKSDTAPNHSESSSFDHTTRQHVCKDFETGLEKVGLQTLRHESNDDLFNVTDVASRHVHTAKSQTLATGFDNVSDPVARREKRSFLQQLKNTVLPLQSRRIRSRSTTSNLASLSGSIYSTALRSFSFASDSKLYANLRQRKDVVIGNDSTIYEEVESNLETSIYEDLTNFGFEKTGR